jgi:murein DD-endopeptidase MepM/ murein hydrolase activator NlpD
MRDADEGSAAAPALLFGAGTVVALAAAMRSHNVATVDAAGRASSEKSTESSVDRDLWVWPLPRWSGYEPTISDGYGSRRTDAQGNQVKHAGVDIMYPRRYAADQRDLYPPRTKHGARNYFMPDVIAVLAVRDGQVWSAGKTPRGYAVVLDHGPPWASFYQHLSEMFVQPTQRGKTRQAVRAGDVIGHVGADPLDAEGLMHLHFELWYRGAHESAIDPAPLMNTWLIAPATASLVAYI